MATADPTISRAQSSVTASPTGEPAVARLQPHHARWLLLSIAGIALLGDLTLRVTPWGLNFLLWTGMLSAGAWFTIRRLRHDPPLETLLWLGAAATFASFFAWRDAGFLSLWNFAAVCAALSLATVRLGGVETVTASVGTVTSTALLTVRNLLAGPATIAARDIPWNAITGPRRRLTSHALGVALAIPALLVFGSLFASADPVFNTLVVNLFEAVALDLETLLSHGLLFAFLAWLSAGYLRGLIRTSRPKQPLPQLEGVLATSTVIIPLSAVASLFLVFVGIQVGYFFGGEGFVRHATGLTYAEYARKGFFELVAATALVIPLLLVAQWAINASDLARRSYRAVALVLLLLVDLVTISAILRMRLYTVTFGLTEDRLYATALMFWIGFMLAWFAATALRDRRGFAFGGLISGFALLATLNVLNPDGLIVKANVARVERSESLDVTYINSLSDDAVPAIVNAWRSFDVLQRCELRNGVYDREHRRTGGWRSWNLSRWRASRASLDLTGSGEEIAMCHQLSDAGEVIE